MDVLDPKAKIPNPKVGCVPPNENLRLVYDQLQKWFLFKQKNEATNKYRIDRKN